MSFDDALNRVLARHDEISALLQEPGVDIAGLSKELSDLTPVVEHIRSFQAARVSLQEAQAMLADPELRSLAEEEYQFLKKTLPDLERAVRVALLPVDEADQRSAILEIRAGTGGEEAALFAATLFRMYGRYAALKGWSFETLDMNETGLGGYREVIVSINGRSVFGRLKYESGVHRVQRVPETESSGRIHTSAATVAVLPEARDVDVNIDEKDLRVDTYRSQGAGDSM